MSRKGATRVAILFGGSPMKIAAYFRCSTDEQSIQHQEQAVNDWVESQGYEPSKVVRFTDEGKSGRTQDRPGYLQMLEQVSNGTVDRIIMFETSRASRNFMEYLRFLELCQKNNTEVEIIGKGVQSFATSQDMLMASVHAFLNQAERERISERTKSALAERKRQGVRLGAPNGNQNRKGKRKVYDPNLVREVLKLADEGYSNRAIASELSKKTPAIRVSYETVRRIRGQEGQCRK